MAESMSDVFQQVDDAFMKEMGLKKVGAIMTDIHNTELSLKEVSERNNVAMSTVTQVARFHKIDPVTLEPTP